ncbi:MAG: biotin synthase BioB [Pseudomonadota bacterium]
MKKGIARKEARELMDVKGHELDELLRRAGEVRRRHYGREVRLCAIINAKSGRCKERCSFCSQSKHFDTDAPVYPLKTPDEILDAALRAEKDGAGEFSIVTSGRSVRSKKELACLEKSIRMIAGRTGMKRCASMGEIPADILAMLKQAGLQCYHHNVETAPSFHPEIVSTHSFDDEVRMVESARDAGLVTCCGGIFGMGESPAQRVELIFAVRDVDPDYVPLNFLNPVRGTPLEGRRDLAPVDCLKIIAITRLAMPDKHITVCGGREVNLGDRQKEMFDAGASGTMVGDYLTTNGQAPLEDRKMIEEAGYEIAKVAPSAQRKKPDAGSREPE